MSQEDLAHEDLEHQGGYEAEEHVENAQEPYDGALGQQQQQQQQEQEQEEDGAGDAASASGGSGGAYGQYDEPEDHNGHPHEEEHNNAGYEYEEEGEEDEDEEEEEDDDEYGAAPASSGGGGGGNDLLGLFGDPYGGAGGGGGDMADMIRQAREEQDAQLQVNEELQRDIVNMWQADRSNRFSMEQKMGRQTHGNHTRTQYVKMLEQVNKLYDDMRDKQHVYQEKIERLSANLDYQDERATELNETFKKFKREIAKEAYFERSGKQIKLKRILAFEAREEEKDKEVEAVRLRNIHYMNRLEKLEQDMKRKEELAEGLHLIDFEQLKIENQTLNEKIEERADELHKLRKKTTNTVQVLTHVKEKLKFVGDENQVLARDLSQLDEQVTSLRDRLTKAKHARDALRAENAILKQQQGFVDSDTLVNDFEMRKIAIEKARAKVAELRTRHASLTRQA